MQIQKIQARHAIDFVQKYHYSKILPRLTKHYLGFFEDDKLVGVLTLGWGTQPLQTIKKIFPEHNLDTSSYLEIGKMCFIPEKNKSNFGSQALSQVIHWMKENTDTKFLYTLADGIMGKCGYVYQASNFRYLGSFKTSVYFNPETGEKIHPKSAKGLCVENATWEGKEKVFWLTHEFCEEKRLKKIQGLMYRYILPLSKPAKKILNYYSKYQGKKYPKDLDLVFEERICSGQFAKCSKPDFNMNVFTNNYQKYGDISTIDEWLNG